MTTTITGVPPCALAITPFLLPQKSTDRIVRSADGVIRVQAFVDTVQVVAVASQVTRLVTISGRQGCSTVPAQPNHLDSAGEVAPRFTSLPPDDLQE